jgi:predicted RNA-binding protein with PUA-like domain
MPRRYWLMKSEPSTFSFEDLARAPRRTTRWDGVRNYQARNLLRDQVRPGDGVLFYHSSTDPAGVVGTAVVTREAYPDPTQFDPASPHYDPRSKRDAPAWVCVDLRYDRPFHRTVTLQEIRATPALAAMELLRKGNRLSVQPVTKAEWRRVLRLGGLEDAD